MGLLTPRQYWHKRKYRLEAELAPHYAKLDAGEPVCRNEIGRLRRELNVACIRLAELEMEKRRRPHRDHSSYPGGYILGRREPKLAEAEKHVYPVHLMSTRMKPW